VAEETNIVAALDYIYMEHVDNAFYDAWLDWMGSSALGHRWMEAFGYTWKVPSYLWGLSAADFVDAEEFATYCYFPHAFHYEHKEDPLLRVARSYWTAVAVGYAARTWDNKQIEQPSTPTIQSQDDDRVWGLETIKQLEEEGGDGVGPF